MRRSGLAAEDKEELAQKPLDGALHDEEAPGDEPIVDVVGADNDDSGLDVVNVLVIGAAVQGCDDAESMPEDDSGKDAGDDAGDIEPEPKPDAKAKKRPHVLRNALIAVAAVLVVAIGAFAGWLAYDDSQNASCHVPQGVTLDGADIGGFSAAEVRSAAARHVVSGDSGSLTLTLSIGQSVELEYARLGSVDIDATVEAAMATIEASALNRCLDRAASLFGMAKTPSPVKLQTVSKLSKEKVKEKVEALSRQCATQMQNAGYKFDTSSYKVKTTKAKTGYAIDIDNTVKAIMSASKKGLTQVAAADEVVQPERTNPGQAIFVSLSECHLYFYVDGKVKKDYPCTPGKSGYETPSGDWTLEYKDAAPTWYNPHSDWSKSMPETIAPGANNPLGLRALALSCGGGIYIHGTTNYGELGSTGSHGCIRLANENVVELFDLVETGIPIFVH